MYSCGMFMHRSPNFNVVLMQNILCSLLKGFTLIYQKKKCLFIYLFYLFLKFHALQRQMDRYAGKVTGCHPLLPDKGVGQRQAVIALK